MDLAVWKKKRQSTLWAYLINAFIRGTDIYLINITIIPYLEQHVKTKKVQLYYALSILIFCIIAAFSSILISRIVDRTRKVNISIYISTCFGIVGSLVYMIYYTPASLLVGRAISGVFAAESYVLDGELLRTYNNEESSRVQWWYSAAMTLGNLFGSWIGLAFVDIEFHIGSFVVNRHNFVGLFLSGILLLDLPITFLLSHDCSKEYDLKTVFDTERTGSNPGNMTGAYINNNDDLHVTDITHEVPLDDFNTNLKTDTSEHSEQTCLKSDGNTEKNTTEGEYVNRKSSQHEDGACHPSDHMTGANVNHIEDFVITNTFKETSSNIGETGLQDNACQSTHYGDTSIPTGEIEEITVLRPHIPTKISLILKRFIRHPEIVLNAASTFLFAGTANLFPIVIPLLILNIWSWSEQRLILISSIRSILFLLALLLCSKVCVSNKRIFGMTIFSIVCNVICLALLMIMTLVNLQVGYQIALIVLFILIVIPTDFLDQVTLPLLLGKIIPADIQSFTESMRSSISLAGIIGAGILVAMEIDFMYSLSVLILLSLILLMFFILRRKHYRNMKVLEFT